MSDLSVFVSADIEGVSGWLGDDESTPAARSAMVDDVNAAIRGVLEAAPDASVLVADSHGDKRTIPPDELHERASLLRGGPRPFGMVDGATAETDLAFLVGYHDRPGTGGFLEHTFTGSIADVRLNGRSVGEFELNAVLLAARSIPVGFVTGDDRLGETVADRLPSAAYVTTKTGRGWSSAVCRHPDAVREEIRETAAAVTADPPTDPSTPVPVELPLTVEVEYARASYADIATLWPGVERDEDARTVVHEAADVPTAYQFVRATTKVRTDDA
ncbi:M55 family metallopeptidase [Halovivax gelatinilyticus]|uniref:M55 family metallopeptidase n=1 Tax=Halovivax gelatinilyticus TaxID=2961597 RepID=UPI0020CA2E8C|nr:M55 family metallopeptidase [Halovivax gelatinilyticus]